MLMRKLIWALAGILVVLSSLGIASINHFRPASLVESSVANGARFIPADCWFDAGSSVRVQCGWLHTAPAAGKSHSSFQLPVIILRYQGLDRLADPVLYLAGGPGSPAGLDGKTMNDYWLDWFQKKSALKRDLILFDQRGSGLSKPALACEGYPELLASVLGNPGSPQDNARRYREASRQCQQQLQQRGMPLAELGTAYNAADVHDLMQLLGYAQWNLLGVSYGTRLAFEVQRQYPDKVRSLSLDSVYPPGQHLLEAWPELLQGSLNRLFAFCKADSRCALENGELDVRYQRLLTQLREQPLVVPVGHLQLPHLQALRLNDELLLSILFDAEYQSHSLGELAALLRHLDEGHPEQSMAFIENFLYQQFDASTSEAVFWSVECRDNPPSGQAEREARLDALPQLRYYLPAESDLCDIWRGDATQSARLQGHVAERNVPALILAGKDDPITPVAWATQIAKQGFVENRAHLFRFDDIAHGVMDNKPCSNDLFIGFVNAPDKRPRADCRWDEPTTTASQLN